MRDTHISVILYDHTGRYLFSSPLTDYRISQAGAETLVLEMKNDFHRYQLAADGRLSAASNSANCRRSPSKTVSTAASPRAAR